MDFVCVIDQFGEIVTVGTFDKDKMKALYPDHTVVNLTNAFIPREYTKDCYQAVLKDGKYTLLPKSDEAIEAIENTKADVRRKRRKEPSKESLLALMAIDSSAESETLKTIVEFLQDVYGGMNS